jgi:hypothetical protein
MTYMYQDALFFFAFFYLQFLFLFQNTHTDSKPKIESFNSMPFCRELKSELECMKGFIYIVHAGGKSPHSVNKEGISGRCFENAEASKKILGEDSLTFSWKSICAFGTQFYIPSFHF